MRLSVPRVAAAGLLVGVALASGAFHAGPAFGVAGVPAPADGYGFVAHILADDGPMGTDSPAHACSGALVDPEWVITAGGCLPAVSTEPWSATVTVGREDLTATGEGQVRRMIEKVHHPSRGLTMLRLSSPVVDVTPVRIGTTAPAAGDVLQVAGFGRTAAEWVPNRLHNGSFRVQAVTEASVDIADPSGAASVCRGDAGGPALRTTSSGLELVALNGPSWQAGCLGVSASETRREAVETRVDNVKGWIQQTVRGGTFVRLTSSATVLDTRPGIGTDAGPRQPGSTTTFRVAGVGGIPTNAKAVLVDVTAVATTAGSVTVFPAFPRERPEVTTVHASGGQTISNTAVVALPSTGELSVFNTAGGTHIVVDVEGYFLGGVGGGFVGVEPTRLVDTRSDLGGSPGKVSPGQSKTFTLTGGVIPTGSAAVVLDLTVTGATSNGWIGTGPNRSVMDYEAGTTSHAVAVQLGTDGRATFTNNTGSAVDLVMTATGHVTANPATGLGLRTMAPVRKLDTQAGNGAPVPANGTVDVALGVPAGSTAWVNLTVLRNTAGGFFRAWPLGGTEPTASFTTYPAPNGVRSGLAAVRVGTDGKIRVRNTSTGTAHIQVDLQGWHAQPLAGPAGGSAGGTVVARGHGDTIEDFVHPGAAQIQTDLGITLKRGDGNLMLADCGGVDNPLSAPADLIVIETYRIGPQPRFFCFRARGTSGWLTMEIDSVFVARGDNAHTVYAVVEPIADPTARDISVIAPGATEPIGIGEGDEHDGVLVELRYPQAPNTPVRP